MIDGRSLATFAAKQIAALMLCALAIGFLITCATVAFVILVKIPLDAKRACEHQHNAPCQWVLEKE